MPRILFSILIYYLIIFLTHYNTVIFLRVKYQFVILQSVRKSEKKLRKHFIRLFYLGSCQVRNNINIETVLH